jgi:hypothetical protein
MASDAIEAAVFQTFTQDELEQAIDEMGAGGLKMPVSLFPGA